MAKADSAASASGVAGCQGAAAARAPPQTSDCAPPAASHLAPHARRNRRRAHPACRCADLPAALEGMVACQLSDLHVDRDEDLERLVLAVGAVNAQQPDLVFLTGDYFTGPRDDAPLPGGISRGDKRTQAAPGRFRGRRQSRSLVFGRADHRGARAGGCARARQREPSPACPRRVAGGGRNRRPVVAARRARRAHLRRVRPEECTIVLAHNPDTALYARHLNPGVMLSGHTHGGVVRLPFYGSPLKLFCGSASNFTRG